MKLLNSYIIIVCRAGRYLGILVIPRYGNQTVCVSSKINFSETILSISVLSRLYRV